MARVQDCVAVVTGGASGIGRASALLMAEEGAHVVMGDLECRPHDDALASARIVQMPCDVRREADVARLMETAISRFGRLDIVLSNAGVGLDKQIPDVSEAEWDAVLDTNLKGAFFCAKHGIPRLMQSGGGVLIYTSSNAGIMPRAHDPVYSISKGALNALVKSLALCHAGDGIRVNAVCPGPVGDTGMMDNNFAQAEDRAACERAMIAASPLARRAGRMITPREVAEAVLYLASDAAKLVTGTLIAIDGGKSLGTPAR